MALAAFCFVGFLDVDFFAIVDQAGTVLVHRNLPARRDLFLNALAPYRAQGIVVAAECMFAWYWLADLCAEYEVPFVLGHALYMKDIHGGKTKTGKAKATRILARQTTTTRP